MPRSATLPCNPRGRVYVLLRVDFPTEERLRPLHA